MLLGTLGLSSGVAAQQPAAVQQSTTVQQTNTDSGATTGPGSQQISQRRDNRATITNTGGSTSVTVSQTNGAQSSTTPPPITDPASGPPGADPQTPGVPAPPATSTGEPTTGTVIRTTGAQGSAPPSSTVTTSTPPGADRQTPVVQSGTTTARAGSTAATEAVQLLAGCSNVALTWPSGTPLATVAMAVDPPHALTSIFKLDAAVGRYRGYSPTAPAFANDYTAIETTLEAVFVCVNQAASLARPTS
jgi:hypothetical protein